MERLQKFMASCGVASRRKCEELIAEGRVMVNGMTVTEAGRKIQPGKDQVELDGKVVGSVEKRVYVMLNKPVGYVSTANDQFGRPTVLDLVKEVKQRIYPVGRLDYDSQGLILLSNDGDFTYGLTHPQHNVDKTYIAVVAGKPTPQQINRLKKGVLVDGYMTSPAKVQLTQEDRKNTMFRIIIHEGRNRQVRKMFEAIGYTVISLKRAAIGKLEIGSLAPGQWRHLKEQEVNELFKEFNGR